jgi:uncharacterized membrane protein YqaE (UPF0057 family)
MRRSGVPLLRTLAAVVLAPILPPAAVFIVYGVGVPFYVSALLALLAYGVFQFLFAGPGLILWGLGILYALACAVRAIWHRPALAATR